MAKKLKNISTNHDLEYFTNKENFPNQDLVKETIEYFETGEGARVFKPIPFLNLLEKHYNFVVNNFKQSEKIISHFKALPLNELEKHTLLGLIIKWFGGYPFNEGTDFDENWLAVKRGLQNEFLSYPIETPEKEFCKADYEQKKQFMKLGIVFTTALNNNMDIGKIYKAMDDTHLKEENYSSFDELFEVSTQNKIIGNFENKEVFLSQRIRYNFEFNVWLQETKHWEYGNEIQYQTFLNKGTFLEYLKYKKSKSDETNFKLSVSENSFQIFQEKYNKLREKFRIKRIATKKDCEMMPRLNIGDVIEHDPEYKTTEKAYELLTQYYSKVYFELEKHLFTEKYRVWNKQTIEAEILEIEIFINYSKELGVKEAVQAFGKFGIDKVEYVYTRLECGFYEHLEIMKYPFINSIGNDEARTYGRYFLFYEFLKSLQIPLHSNYYNIPLNNIVYNYEIDELGNRDYHSFVKNLNEQFFQSEIKRLNPGEIANRLEFHLRYYTRKGGNEADFIKHTKAIMPKNLTPEQKDSYLTWLENCEQIFETLTNQQTETKTKILKAPVLGIFCNLINEIGIEKKGETESAETYCKRICKYFTLPYSDRVRQNYNTNKTQKHLKELKEKILPIIDSNVRFQIENHLDNNNPTKPKLYA